MGKTSGLVIFMCFLMALQQTWAQDNSGLIYFNDFEASAGNEWSNNQIEQTPNGQKFLGRFNNSSLTLTVGDLAAHQRIRVSFDLYIIRSWDGDERWGFSIDGTQMLYTSFAHWSSQAYPGEVNQGVSNPTRTGATGIGTLGWGSDGWGDTVYRMSFTSLHTANAATLNFSGSNLEGIDNESWGIDNIKVLAYSGIIVDSNLKAKLATMLSKDGNDIKSTDLQQLTSLDARNLSIQDLTGLETGKNLTTLNLDNNQIIDLSSLATLKEVTELTLDNNLITSVEPLNTWRGQVTITLNNNKITDLAPLVDNPWLSGEIQIKGNPLSSAALLSQIPTLKERGFTVLHDDAPVDAVKFADSRLENHLRSQLNKTDGYLLTATDLQQLTSLDASNLSIQDLTGLEQCTNLTHLELHRNQISNIAPLASLINLTYLQIQENKISNISTLSQLINLTSLYAPYNEISDLPNLSGLTNLTRLELHRNQISNITPLASLINLTYLQIQENEISDLSPLKDFPQLQELHISDNQISSIPSGLTSTTLTTINLNNNQLTDISGLSNLSNLQWVDLGNNQQLTDYSPLENLAQLRTLQARNNQLSSASAFESLIQLTYLDLQDNQIVDISALGNMAELNELKLKNNRIVDVSVLANIPEIGRIGLAHNQIFDVSPLQNLTQLYRLGLRDNRINNATPLANLVNLQRMGLQENPLSNVTLTYIIPGLQNQGAQVEYNGFKGTALQLRSISLEKLIRNQVLIPLPQTYNGMNHILTSDNTTTVTALDLADSSVTNLSGLEGLSNLTSVDISGLQLSLEAINSQIPALEANGIQFINRYDWRASLTVQASDEQSTLNPQTVFFGVAATATDGLNEGLDIPAPPISPTTDTTDVPLDCRLASPDATDPDLLTDFRSNSSSPYQYRLKIYQADVGNLSLDWDISSIPSRFSTVRLKQIETDNPPPAIDLHTTTTATLTLEAGIYHTFELLISESTTISLSEGWNMFSIPGDPLITDPADLFGSDSGVVLPLYRWNPEQFTYQPANKLKAGDGYWLLLLATTEAQKQVEIPYQAIDSYQKNLATGWNMIGSTTQQADFTDPQDDPDKSILQHSLFGWNAAGFSYQLSDQILPGKGYWVLALSSCQLTVTGGATATAPTALKSPEITMPIRISNQTQSYQLTLGLDASASTGLDVYDQLSPPPMPTDNGASAEFELANVDYGLIQDVRPMHVGTNWQLQLNLSTPSKIEIDTRNLPNGLQLVIVNLDQEMDSATSAVTELAAGQHQLQLELRPKIDLPQITRVWQNYPNPFNPETWIPYQLHQVSEVRLQIYDIKGQLIRTLELGQVEPGVYTDTSTAIHWDGKTEMGETVASGTYFYALTTDNYTQTRKMIILK